MKRILAVFAFLAALVFVASPSYALYPVNDDVPGRDVFVPFFLVEIGGGGEDSLLIIQETGRQGGGSYAENLKYYFYDIDSNFCGDGPLKISKGGVCAASVYDMIRQLQGGYRENLKYDLDGDGTADHYAGYIQIINNTALNSTTKTYTARSYVNNLVAMMYQIDTEGGFASLVNIPVLEYAIDADSSYLRFPASSTDPFTNRFADNEILNAQALVAAKDLQAGATVADDSSWWRMYPRYYIKDANSKNYLIFWKNDKHIATGQKFQPHFNFWNTNETALSGVLDLKHELNIINLTEPSELIIPDGLHTGYPKAGWIEIEYPDDDGLYFVSTRIWYGYNYQKAFAATAALSWAGLTEIHFDAGTSGSAY